MRGDAVAEQAGASAFTPCEMLRSTIEALGLLDVSALGALQSRAEACLTQWDGTYAAQAKEIAEEIRLKQALSELLRSTERSLRVLRGVHESGVRRALLMEAQRLESHGSEAKGTGKTAFQETPWAR